MTDRGEAESFQELQTDAQKGGWARRRMQQDKGYRGGQITSPQAEIWPSEADVHPLTVSQPNKDLNYLQNLISICALSATNWVSLTRKVGWGRGKPSIV